ncbi:bromo adjacent homology domain-containing 1 protein [Danio rerio]|uniref:Bromo adjacent homology domain-containing 1 protein n=1 Tax=Danio rerio TaxID=7955 RepID=A0AC58I6Z1_DANRE
MTHVWKKASLSEYGGEGRGYAEGWSHDETVGGAWPADSVPNSKMNTHMQSCAQYKSQRLPTPPMNSVNERKRKLYPLRGRGGTPEDSLCCHVLLTRLDEQQDSTNKTREPLQSSGQEPRTRRLASLNAEALNSLLLEKPAGAMRTRAEGACMKKSWRRPEESQKKSWRRPEESQKKTWRRPEESQKKTWRRPEESQKKTWRRPEESQKKSWKRPEESQKKTWRRPEESQKKTWRRPEESQKKTWRRPEESQKKTWRRPEESQKKSWRRPEESQKKSWKRPEESQKKTWRRPEESQKKSLRSPEESQRKTWRKPEESQRKSWRRPEASQKRMKMDLCSPAPRRLAGLNTAALLNISSPSAHHRSVCAVGNDGKPTAGNDGKASAWRAIKLCRPPSHQESICVVCKGKSLESSPTFQEDPGYQPHSILGYPIKTADMRTVSVKEEHAEPVQCCCCPAVGAVEFCHHLPMFLHQQAYRESEEQPVASIRHECVLPAPPLALSHPCLCAEPCYYIHISHPGPTAAARPLPCTHTHCCPRGVSKLLPATGLPHPHPAYCCLCPAARLPYTYLTLPETACSCSFSCSTSRHSSRTEAPPDAPALLLSPGCPSMPLVNRSARECPQNPKPSGHRPLRTTRRLRPAGGVLRRRSTRRPDTNGWRPVGASTQRELLMAGDEQTVLRQCYDSVQRDGELIRVRDTVLLKSGPRRKTLPYVAKISALWEEPRTGELMMSLFWYYRPEHTQGGRDPSMHCEKEIFASRHQDENSVACIEERCYVLPLAQYCRFCALVRRGVEGVCERVPLVPRCSAGSVPNHRSLPTGVDPQLVYLCRHVYDYRYGRILKNLQ